MNAKELKVKLEEANIYMAFVKYNPRETIFFLSCGLRITVYNMSGKFVVKGTPREFPFWNPIAALRRVLPVKETVWLQTPEKIIRSSPPKSVGRWG